jgi:hypothetical protein
MMKKNEIPKYIFIEKKGEASYNSFYNEIEQSLKESNFPNDLNTDPNISYNLLENVITDAKIRHLKPTKARLNHYKHKKNPWITAGIITSIKFRDKLYRRLRKTDPNAAIYQTLEHNLRTFNSILQRNINTAKKMYYEQTFFKHVNDIKKTWSTINDLLNKCKKKNEYPTSFTVHGKEIRDKKDIANQFNNFFGSIGPDLSARIPNHKDLSVKKYLKKEILHSFKLITLEQDEVKKILTSITTKHSSGYDNLSTCLLKKISPLIIGHITAIINQSFFTGIFPDKLKIAKIIPLYKKDDPQKLENYRPISILPAISKLFEKAVFIQLYKYLNTNNLLYKNQYGFRTLHSTEMASLEVIDIILKKLDEKKIPLGIFLDLSKAFDTLDHNILLHKLQYYGVKDVELKWFQSYLCNRFQFVSFEGTSSSMLPMITGVPQGSVLGPLLFILYMNDIHYATDKFHAILFADDTSLTSTLCTFGKKLSLNELSNSINIELKKVQTWLEINKLSLNVKKTKFMIFHSNKRDIQNHIPCLKINEQQIERVNEFNFLGLTLDQHMTWNAHVQKVSNKISKTIGVMNRLKRYLPLSVLRTLYNSLILPHLQYSLLAWGTKSCRLFKLQKRAIRLISSSKYNAHAEPIFKKLNLLKIEDLYKLKIMKLYYNYTNRKLPKYFESMFTLISNTCLHNTRQQGIFYQFTTKTVIGHKCVRHILPEVLNKTQKCITDKVSTHSYQGFSLYTKKIFIKSYNETCVKENCYICHN